MDDDRKQGLSGRDLQASQAGGESGEYGGNMQQQQAAAMVVDEAATDDEKAAVGQMTQSGSRQSRGEAYDEQQGGGRDSDSVSRAGSGTDADADADEEMDQR